jgi:hypothetical protein
MLGYTVQTGDSGDKPRSQEESKKEISSNGRAIKAATKKERARCVYIVYIGSVCFCVQVF